MFLQAHFLNICVVLYEMNLRDLQNIDRVGLPDVWWKLLLEIRYCSILRPNIGPILNSVRFRNHGQLYQQYLTLRLCSVYTFSNLSNIYSIGSRKTNSFQLIPFFWLNIGVSYKPERISYDAKLKCQNCSRPFDNPWCSIEALKVYFVSQTEKRTKIQCCHQWTWTSL